MSIVCFHLDFCQKSDIEGDYFRISNFKAALMIRSDIDGVVS